MSYTSALLQMKVGDEVWNEVWSTTGYITVQTVLTLTQRSLVSSQGYFNYKDSYSIAITMQAILNYKAMFNDIDFTWPRYLHDAKVL